MLWYNSQSLTILNAKSGRCRIFNAKSEDVNSNFHPEILKSINQSVNQSINVFQGKTQNVQFTNISKNILFFTWYIYDNHDNEEYWIFWVGKQNKGSSCIVAVFTMIWVSLV